MFTLFFKKGDAPDFDVLNIVRFYFRTKYQLIKRIQILREFLNTIFRMLSISLKDGLSRRNFLRIISWAGLISCSAKPAFAAIDVLSSEERSLALYNTRTKESFDGVFWRNGDFVTSALKNINHIMRDTRTNDVKQIHPDLLDLIYKISMKLKSKRPIHVISGYRSQKTNNLLLKRNKDVAKNSYHTKGQAVDIHLPGLKTLALRRAAYELKMGGIGYYPKRGFVHIDVGPVRYWSA